MLTQAAIEALIRESLQQVAEDQGRAIPYEGPETKLWGSGGVLDSLGLVALIVGIEQRLYEEHGISAMIASEDAMSRRSSPFRTVASLVAYISELVHGRSSSV